MSPFWRGFWDGMGRPWIIFKRHEACARSENANGSYGCWRVRCNLERRCYERNPGAAK